jgi:hypothetical protein
MTIDRQVVAERVRALRATLPQDGDLLTGLQQVTEATRSVVGVDGTGLTLAHEDDQPRWVAVEDLRSERVWERIAAVVAQLRMYGVLSVPVRLARQPVGTLNVYATQPRAWSSEEVEALGAFAAVTAELVRTGVELAVRDAEVAQLRQALTSRVWIEQAKGVLVATQGVTPEEAFQQVRARARSSRRRVAELAQEIVQQAQRERIASLAINDARVREAQARAQQAEAALQAAQTGLARRTTALDRAQDDLDERERAADERNHAADQRERAADERNHAADDREQAADDREQAADARERATDDRDRIADERDHIAEDRDQAPDYHD